MSDGENFTEYAVEVPGRGFATWAGPLSAEAEYWVRNINEANDLAANLRSKLMALRCDDIMVTMRIVSRIVTIERGDWCPYLSVAEMPASV